MPETTVPLDDLATQFAALRQAKALAKQWAGVADTLLDDIKERLGEAGEGTVNGQPAIRRTERTVTRLDTKTLRAEIPEPVLAPYLKTTTEIRYDLLLED